MSEIKIENSGPGDFYEIFRLYAIASAYQQSKNVVVWPTFEKELVNTEIAENRQWKLLIDDVIACYGPSLLQTKKFGKNEIRMRLFIYIVFQQIRITEGRIL